MISRIFDQSAVAASFAAGAGARERIAEFDWGSTALGPVSAWPETLGAMVRMILASPLPMCLLVGPDGILIYNDGYAVIAGRRHPEILGMAAAAAWPEAAAFNAGVIASGLAGECLRLHDREFVLNRNGAPETVWLDLEYSPVTGPDGVPVAILAILAETTKRVVAERALARSNEKLSFALAASGAVGAWDWDLATDTVTADARFAEMYGVDVDEAARGTTIRRFVAGVHDDDRAALDQRIEAAIESGADLRAEYRLKGSDGAVRWVMALGRVITDASGKALRLPGIIVDITERKAAEEALAASEAGFRALADSMPQMVWSTRPDGFHDYYNARWYEFTGVPAGSTDGEGWNDMFHPEDRDRARDMWQHSLATGDPYQIEYRLRHHSGEYRWTLGRALPVRDAAGRITRWFGTCTDIHESRLAAEEREIIAQELSHRIKNIFSVLTGIIALSARSHPGMKPLADQLRSRISAMGKAHDLVRPHSKASRRLVGDSSLRSLITQLVSPFQQEGHPKVFFSGDDIAIDDASATPMALFVHELATNAAKYGALAASDGKVAIHGTVDEMTYRMSWKETGGATLGEAARGEGFGSRLITLSIEGQLGGTLARFWEQDGLKVELALPLASLRRSSKLRG